MSNRKHKHPHTHPNTLPNTHSRAHSNAHSHPHSHDITANFSYAKKGRDSYLNRAFVVGIALNLVFVAVEFIAGVVEGSVALMSDAGHNLSDAVSLALALLAFRLARQKPTKEYTYGRKKSTIIVSLANACILLVAIGIILYESIQKLLAPQPIEGGVVAWVAGVGIIINTFTAWLFLRHSKNDLNIRGAYLHMVADALVSVGVVISGLIISFTGFYILDSLVGIVVAVIIFISTWGLLRDSIRLSLDGVPSGIDTREIEIAIASQDVRIRGVHHIHIWAMSTTENALTAHIVVDSTDDTEGLKQQIKKMLTRRGICHSTLEFEPEGAHENNYGDEHGSDYGNDKYDCG